MPLYLVRFYVRIWRQQKCCQTEPALRLEILTGLKFLKNILKVTAPNLLEAKRKFNIEF